MIRRIPVYAGIALPFALYACAASARPGTGAAPHQEQVVSIAGGSGTTEYRYYADVQPVVTPLPVAPQAAWNELAAAYRAVGLPITTVDSTNRLVGAVRVPINGRLAGKPLSDLLDCGRTFMGLPRANEYQVSLTAVTQLVPAARGTNAVTAVTAAARDPNSSSTPVQCSSLGALEQQIATRLSGAGQ